MAVPTVKEPTERLLNRELSLLDFHARVLELAADESVPLLERVLFCSIFSSNVDEFFQVRVAGLLGQAESGLAVRSADGLTPQQALSRIRDRVLELTTTQSKLWKRELRAALAAEGIVIGRIEDCGAKELKQLEQHFEREIYPVLTPLAVGPGQPFPYISGLSLSLAVFVADPETARSASRASRSPKACRASTRSAVAGCTSRSSRSSPTSCRRSFPGRRSSSAQRSASHVTRTSRSRTTRPTSSRRSRASCASAASGTSSGLEVSTSASAEMVDRLTRGLDADEPQIYRIESPLDLADLKELHALDRPDLKFEPWLPVIPPRLEAAQADAPRIFDDIRRADLAVHQPYESFRGSFEVLAQAAVQDPDVIAMKTAVYRTSDDSVLVGSLIQCAEEGKQSVCLVELKARFDERRNIEWSRALEQAGVHVAYGFPDLKIHAKMTLIVRRERSGLRRYAHIATGNYHAATARLYEDFGIFTADEEIAADVADLFNYITGFGRPTRFRKLLVAPFTLRSGLVEEIRGVAAAAAAGEKARIRLKVNHLVDPGIVDELYAASQAGASIDVIARTTCALRPGVEGLSENIRVRSIVGRFLEHSRIYAFDAGERTAVYIGSADLMARNLDHRIEVIAPVENARVRQELNAILDSALADTTNAWELAPDGTWTRIPPEDSGSGERIRRR